MIVGIDVSKDKLDIKILPINRYFKINNQKSSIRSFLKNNLLKLGTLDLVVFESTGGYEKNLMVCLINEGMPFHRAHPNRAYHFARGKGFFAKTDRIDANILAQYGHQEEITADHFSSEDTLKIQELSARKIQLKEMITQEKNRLHCLYINAQIQRSIKRCIKQLEKELQMVNDFIEKFIETHETYKAKRKLLQTISGVGHEVSTMMVTDMPELGRLNREEISKMVGVAPQTKDSGKKQGYRSIGHGRFYVRRALYRACPN